MPVYGLEPHETDLIRKLLWAEWTSIDAARRPMRPPEDKPLIDEQRTIETLIDKLGH